MMNNTLVAAPGEQIKGSAFLVSSLRGLADFWLQCLGFGIAWVAFSALGVSHVGAQEVTDGYRIFLEDDKDYFWDKRNEAFNHIAKMSENKLLVRLKEEKKRIAYMEERGKKIEAGLVQQEADALNQKLISGFKKYFDYCDVYFYYPSDANEIFKNKKFELLYTDLETRVSDVHFEYMPYVMKYETANHLRYSDAKKINLYSWNSTQLERIERFYFPRIGIGRWTRKFKKRMKKENRDIPEDLTGLNLLIFGFNGACHGISIRQE